jgi:ankyrin repeat protein
MEPFLVIGILVGLVAISERYNNLFARRENPSLVQAIDDHNPAAIERALGQPGELEHADDVGVTPLMAAARMSNCDLARRLIRRGANVNASAEAVGTPLMIALSLGDVEMAKLLLDSGADPNFVTPLGDCPFLHAVRSQNLRCIKIVVSAGAVTMSDKWFENPLNCPAISDDEVGVVQFLLDLGVNPNRPGLDGTLPLEHAKASGANHCAAVLLAAGAREVKTPAPRRSR